MSRLLLLGRPECHLCEEFADDLRRAFPAAADCLEEACVDDRPEWRERFGTRIPVLLAEDGAVLCETVLDPESVRRWLRRRQG